MFVYFQLSKSHKVEKKNNLYFYEESGRLSFGDSRVDLQLFLQVWHLEDKHSFWAYTVRNKSSVPLHKARPTAFKKSVQLNITLNRETENGEADFYSV